MKNQTFNWSRFLNLVKYDWRINGRAYLLALSATLALSVVIGMLLTNNRINREMRFDNEAAFVILFGLGVVAILFGIFTLRDFRSREGLISFLQLPASNFEKYVQIFLISFVIPIAACVCIFLISEQVMLMYFKWKAISFEEYWAKNLSDPKFYGSLSIEKAKYYGQTILSELRSFPFTKTIILMVSSVYFGIHSYFVYGHFLFKRFAFLKTILTGIIFVYAFIGIMFLMVQSLRKPTDPFDLGLERYAEHWVDKVVLTFPSLVEMTVAGIAFSLFFFIASGVMWLMILFKMKEKEVR